MPLTLSDLKEYFSAHKQEILADYFTYLRFPSISSEASFAQEMHSCAQWVRDYLTASGLTAELWPTEGHPTVFAQDLSAGADKPTLLLYGHYDVQPVDPLELWHSPPFEPTVRDGAVYARGAQDNKGQGFYTMLALRAVRKLAGRLPINVKIIIEGEEEWGSRHLADLIATKGAELTADALAIVDMGIPKEDIPAVTLGCRGIATLDVEVKGASTDLHSGSHGGLVYNANHALIEMLAKLHDASGAIAIPGFYDDVKEVPLEIRRRLYLDFDEEEYYQAFGARPTGGERHISPPERVSLRPTVEVNGINGGYTGPGFKTVIPARATAKISCRLVPDQTPEATARRVADFLLSVAPPGIEVDIQLHFGGGGAVRADADTPVVRAFCSAYEEIFQKPCQYLFEGGSIPIVPVLAQASGADIVLVGMGLHSDKIHAPNEHFHLDRLEKGFLLIGNVLDRLREK